MTRWGTRELIETLYVLDGWPSVDGCIAQVERALVLGVRSHYFIRDSTHPKFYAESRAAGFSLTISQKDGGTAINDAPSAGVLLVGEEIFAPPLDPAAEIDHLAHIVEEREGLPQLARSLRAVRPDMSLFLSGKPTAKVQGANAFETGPALQALAMMVLHMAASRRTVAFRVVRAMRSIEREATRMLSATLLDASAEILRETRRYFKLEPGEARLELVNRDPRSQSTESTISGLSSDEILARSREDSPQPLEVDIALRPEAIGELKDAVGKLLGHAKVVLQLEKDASGRPNPTASNYITHRLQVAHSSLALEAARHALRFPVLARFSAQAIYDTQTLDSASFGRMTLSILARAWGANARMQRRMSGFVGMDGLDVYDRRPDIALAIAVGKGKRLTSIWSLDSCVARAANLVAGDNDDIARRAGKMRLRPSTSSKKANLRRVA